MQPANHSTSGLQLLRHPILNASARQLQALPPPSPWRGHRIAESSVPLSTITGRQKPQSLSPMGSPQNLSPINPGMAVLQDPSPPLSNLLALNQRKPLPALGVEVQIPETTVSMWSIKCVSGVFKQLGSVKQFDGWACYHDSS